MVDYRRVGLKVGLEIHQELDTRHKLFCKCPPELFKGEPEFTFVRRLRPTQSELGEVDPAALFEFEKGKTIVYEATEETSCLVEMDEEPPGPLNEEALDICLMVALMLGSRPVDEVHVMRKVVIDGSNTTGFQRTCVVALGGEIVVNGKRVPIQHICLEEDAARKVGEEGMTVRYRIDRLGIPLIEVTTAPVLETPQEVGRVALAIGRLLRATGRVKRGIGTIRQDLNVSIRDGALIEIKGVQKLELLPKVVEYEVMRQLSLLEIRDELRRRGVKPEDIREDFVDVTDAFKDSKSRVIRKALKRGGVVMAVKLPGFSGLIGREICPGRRLGTEMAERAMFWGRVGGIFHTDELPAYGITEREKEAVLKAVGASELDAAVFVAAPRENCVDALRAVVERAREAVLGVPSETRAANPDGTTRYMRPRPGAARMYPETDIPPIVITPERVERVRSMLPEMPDEAVRRVVSKYGINEVLAWKLVDSGYLSLFERIASKTAVAPSFIAATLTETFVSLRRDGVDVEALTDAIIEDVFTLVDRDVMAKEAVPDVFRWLAEHPGSTAEEAVEELGLRMLSREEVADRVRALVRERMDLVRRLGSRAVKPLMGEVMRELRGRAKANMIYEILREELENVIPKEG